MSRKKWRSESWPGAYRRSHTSMLDAYRYVNKQRADRELGAIRTTMIVVQVNEGSGWHAYERCQMPTPNSEAVSDAVFE